jgi:hypothetical protein
LITRIGLILNGIDMKIEKKLPSSLSLGHSAKGMSSNLCTVSKIKDATMALAPIKLNEFIWDKVGTYPAYSHML